jgi:MFS family permease
MSAIEMDGAAAGATRVRWTHVAPTLLVIWIVSMFDKAGMSIVQNNQAFLDDFQLNGQQVRIGQLTFALFLAYGLFAPVWGWVVVKLGARKTAAVSLVVWGLACFWSGLAADYNSLFWSRAFLGFGEAALYPYTVALVANWFALKERGRATSFWWIGTMIGPMLMGLFVTWLIVNYGWRGQFHAIGILTFIVPLPMMWFLVRDTPAEHAGANAAEARLVSLGSLENNQDAPGRLLASEGTRWARNPRFWLVTIAISANAIFYWGWSIWLPTYLRTARGLSFQTSGYLTFVIFGFAMLTILAVGQYSDRVFRRAPLALAGWVGAAVFLMIGAYAPDVTWAIVFNILSLCSLQVAISSAEMLIHSVCSEKDMGASQGVRSFFALMTGALSPLAIGYILQNTGNNYIVVFAMLAGAVVVSAACMLRLIREGY